MAKKVFIWDFHGTLETGTVFILTEIANKLLEENGSTQRYTPDEFAGIPSFSWNTFFRKHFPDCSQEEVNTIAREAYNENRFAYLMDKYSQPRPGALSVLQAVKASGGVNVVVSHSRQDKLEYYLSHVGLIHVINEYYGVDDGTVASWEDVLKKKVLVIKKILAQHSSAHSYGVGDSDTDFYAAQSSGIDYFYWLLPANNKVRKEQLHKDVPSDRLKFLLELEEIVSDL